MTSCSQTSCLNEERKGYSCDHGDHNAFATNQLISLNSDDTLDFFLTIDFHSGHEQRVQTRSPTALRQRRHAFKDKSILMNLVICATHFLYLKGEAPQMEMAACEEMTLAGLGALAPALPLRKHHKT